MTKLDAAIERAEYLGHTMLIPAEKLGPLIRRFKVYGRRCQTCGAAIERNKTTGLMFGAALTTDCPKGTLS